MGYGRHTVSQVMTALPATSVSFSIGGKYCAHCNTVDYGRRVTVGLQYLDLAHLVEVAQHHYELGALLPHHAPEVDDSRGQRALQTVRLR